MAGWGVAGGCQRPVWARRGGAPSPDQEGSFRGGEAGGVVPEAGWGWGGEDAFAEPVGIFQVGVAGEDELLDAEVGVLLDALGDLGVGPDQGGTGTASGEADAGPEVGGDLQAVGAAA